MLHLVNDILDFSQLESKTLILNLQVCNLRALITECVDALSFKAESKGLQLKVNLDMNFPTFYKTDQSRLLQILINLTSNAIKYTQTGGLVIILGEIDVQYNRLMIHVEDTGVGIPLEKMHLLFNAFTKIMNNRDLNKEGCGLGLTISQMIAKALGGMIKVKSEVGIGSRFTLVLPIESGSDDNQALYVASSGDQHYESGV